MDKPDWSTDGADWPSRAASRFVEAGGLRWHVQVQGAGPVALLLHGSGGATHSWAGLAPLLARRLTVVAPDLPGHGFTATPASERLDLPGVAAAVAALVRALGVSPALLVGHSAGAAVACRLALDGAVAPRGIAALAPALLVYQPAPGPLAPLVNAAARSPLAASLLSGLALAPALSTVLRSTGSRSDARTVELYRRLAARPGHVHAVLTMMSRWRVEPLLAELPRLRVPVELVFGAEDRWIDRAAVERATAALHGVRYDSVAGAGHLLHEEQPEAVAARLLAFARRVGALPAG